MKSVVCTLLLSVLVPSASFAATTYSFADIHRFPGGSASGNPQNQLAQDAAGNLYGTTSFGGNMAECSEQGCGVIYRLSPNGSQWTYTELYQFHGNSAPYPSNLILDAAGNLYGELGEGGPNEAGLVFELTPTPSGPWIFTALYAFTGGADGNFPNSGLVLNATGDLFGTTMSGGQGGQTDGGTVFELWRNDGRWTETVIWNFTTSSTVGYHPYGTVAFDAAGNIYGVTGAPAQGAVYKLTKSSSGWVGNPIYAFTGGADGDDPFDTPTLDTQGNLYGTTISAGTFGGGTVYQLSPNVDGSYAFHTVHSFQFGWDSDYSVILDKAGDVFGVSNSGAGYGGQVYELSPSAEGWSYAVLHSFYSGIRNPQTLMLDPAGDLFGVAFSGGASGCQVDGGCGGAFELLLGAGTIQ
jgi:uncharacterized repeat protein (TIGR03803 family)